MVVHQSLSLDCCRLLTSVVETGSSSFASCQIRGGRHARVYIAAPVPLGA